MVDSDKMSKSLGNFRTIRQTIALDDAPADQAGYRVNPREAEMVRFFIVRNHYRSPQNYTPDNLVDAQNALDRLYQALQNVPADGQGVDWNEPQAQAFKAAMDDDFNSSGAVAALFELASEANRTKSARSAGQLKRWATCWACCSRNRSPISSRPPAIRPWAWSRRPPGAGRRGHPGPHRRPSRRQGRARLRRSRPYPRRAARCRNRTRRQARRRDAVAPGLMSRQE